ncbi:MAG: hypothetical protein H0W84_02575, partial [Bacteroidetes bacterium]|nr:hypothetical protein [Bacteroidota bacterium]
IWGIIVSLGFWISPILFKLDVFRASLPGVDYINPFSAIVINARNTVMYHQFPEFNLFIWGFVYSSFFLLLGMYLLNKLGAKAAEKL